MNKTLLLGLAAAALFALPAFAGEKKIESWDGFWTWYPQLVKEFPVKLKIPWFIRIVNEKNWEIQLEQVECAALGRSDGDWPCFKGCNNLEISCNFNCHIECGINYSYLPGMWDCWESPSDIDAPGGSSTICVKLWKADLLSMPAGTDQTVAQADIWVKPR